MLQNRLQRESNFLIQDLKRSTTNFSIVKILIGSPTSTGIGGIARHVQGLSGFLKSQGHHVEIISSNNTFTIPIKKLKNPSFMLSAFVKSTFKKNFIFTWNSP